MARSVFTFRFNDYDATDRNARAVLQREGYTECRDDGETVWTKGNELMTKKFVKLEYNESELIVSGWVSSMYVEMDLKGLVAALPKRLVVKTIEQIKMGVR